MERPPLCELPVGRCVWERWSDGERGKSSYRGTEQEVCSYIYVVTIQYDLPYLAEKSREDVNSSASSDNRLVDRFCTSMIFLW